MIAQVQTQATGSEPARPARQETNDRGKVFIKPLTGLRFVAAMMVVMHHLLHINVSGATESGTC